MTMTSTDKARQHARHPHYCTCGKVVWGNGANYQHREMHRRRNDGHHYTGPDQWKAIHAKQAQAQEGEG